MKRLTTRALEAFADWKGPLRKIVDWRSVDRAYASRKVRATSTEIKRLTSLMDLLRARDDHRPLVTIADNWRSQLNTLEAQPPNFGEVVDF